MEDDFKPAFYTCTSQEIGATFNVYEDRTVLIVRNPQGEIREMEIHPSLLGEWKDFIKEAKACWEKYYGPTDKPV